MTETTTAHDVTRTVAAFVSREHGHYIDGGWRPAADGGRLESLDPATGRHLASIAAGTELVADVAGGAARRALTASAWQGLSPLDRGELLHAIADMVDAHGDELALIESLDNGKPVS